MQDKEYNPSTHEYSESMEFSVPKDYKSGVADEYNVDTSAYDTAVIKASKEKRASTKKKTVILQTAAAITTVVVATSSFGYDLLGYDIFNSDSSYSGGSGYEQPVVDPDPDQDENIKKRVVLVTYVPTEEHYSSPADTFEAAYVKAYDWAKLKGGLDVEMVFTSSQKVVVGYNKSDDAIIIGDPDAPYETWYIPQGTVTPISFLYYFYKAYPKSSGGSEVIDPGEHADNAFPVLDNLEPNGAVPGYGVINEEYVRLEYFGTFASGERFDYYFTGDGVHSEGGGVYLWAGSAYELRDFSGNPSSCVHYDEYKNMGAYYDRASNTLYLNNFSGAGLNINLMGNGFKIDVTGDCHLDRILAWGFMYGGSITVTGSGRLTVNEALDWDCGIQFLCESSASCLMIDSSVTLDVYGTVAAIELDESTAEKGIYYLAPLKLGGEGTLIQRHSHLSEGTGLYVHTIFQSGPEPGPATHVIFSK